MTARKINYENIPRKGGRERERGTKQNARRNNTNSTRKREVKIVSLFLATDVTLQHGFRKSEFYSEDNTTMDVLFRTLLMKFGCIPNIAMDLAC